MSLRKSDRQSHLTVTDPALERARGKTYPGMAHWAGSGPAQKTCRECTFFKFNGYYAERGNKGGSLKKSICLKYQELMGTCGNVIPHDAESCKYYNKNETPPTITEQRKY